MNPLALFVGVVGISLVGLSAGAAAPEPWMASVLKEAGTTGVVVVLLWRRIDRLENRVEDNEAHRRRAAAG